MAGEKGMILVEYLGSNEGVESYYGPVTGTRYKFSVRKNIGRIDIRDAKTQHNRGLLDLYDKGRKLFQEYRPQPQLAVSKEEAEQVNVQDVSDQPAAPPPQAKPFSEVELPDTVEVAVGAGELQPAEDVLVATQPDELTTIKGIGPKTALKLKAAGIVSFVQLAELTPAALAELALIPEHQAQKILAEVFKIFA